MASLFPDFEYDIFISYRQKDNKGGMWVSEFVEALKTEIEATLKEDISIYFDENPHDRLQDNYNVDKSLEGKLKCLIFIPIISQTYCDPKSYAWQNEFLTFISMSGKDRFGMDIKLRNGNITSRILPVRIHDLDDEDVKLYETEAGSKLRALDFVFKTSAGVNRPLRVNEDHPDNNLNKIYFRDQINKVANAIKEIISALKTEPAIIGNEQNQNMRPWKRIRKEERISENKNPVLLTRHRFLSVLMISATLVLVVIFTYPKIFNRDKLESLRSSDGRISVAVMPFQNMTNDTVWNVWQYGIQDLLITYLSNFSDELKVRQIESISNLIQSNGLTNYAAITPSFASNISKKLDANIFVYGSIKQAGTVLRVNGQLIDTKTEEAFKSFEIEGPAREEMFFQVIDSLKRLVKNYLIISKLEKELLPDYQPLASTKSPEAYRYFIYGQNAYQEGDFQTAVKMFSQALAIDSNFIFATLKLGYSYGNQGMLEEAKKLLLSIYEKREQMPIQLKIRLNRAYAICFETPYEEIMYLKQLQEFDDKMPVNYYNLGETYYRLYQYDKAISELEKALEIYSKWDSKPMWDYNYTVLGEIYHKKGLYKKEEKLYKKAEKDFPDDPNIIYRQAILSLSGVGTIEANRYIEKYILIRKGNLSSEVEISSGLAEIYTEAGILDKAEQYYRQALSLEPDNPERMNNFARFLIDKDRNVSEGLKLADKALECDPDNYLYLDCKGWGLFKQGNFKEALTLLEKSWNLKPIYDYDIYLHLEEVKKAVASKI